MPHHAHSIDRWEDATGSNLHEHHCQTRFVRNSLLLPSRRFRLAQALTSITVADAHLTAACT
jgi:hypothetical protein